MSIKIKDSFAPLQLGILPSHELSPSRPCNIAAIVQVSLDNLVPSRSFQIWQIGVEEKGKRVGGRVLGR